ncbi:MAG: DUF4178 domain-containing protein [Candidatus Riflebacteria bacterium]|nr:DUF4178 domain-containing protein [Candidatus Riflebacteria bacterium]
MKQPNVAYNTSEGALTQVKCTNCSAGISLHEESEIEILACTFCGSCLEVKNNLKVAAKPAREKRPYTQLKIGSTGILRGVRYVNVGILQFTEEDEGLTYQWTEFLLYSRSRGYVWLIFEDNHWVLMTEYKDRLSTQLSPYAKPWTRFSAGEKSFTVFENGIAKLTYFDGNLPWLPRGREVVHFLDAVSPPYIFSIEESFGRQEYFIGEYIPATEALEAFRIAGFEPSTVYPCQPMRTNRLFECTAPVALASGALNMLIYLYRSDAGKIVFQQSFSNTEVASGTISRPLSVAKTSALYSIQVHCPLDNAWGFFDVALVQGDQQFFNLDCEIAYYHGYEDGESWSEGTQSVTSHFRVPEPGSYSLNIIGQGNKGESETATVLQNVPVNIAIREGVVTADYSFWLSIVCFICAIPYYLMRINFEFKRWRSSDGSDDGDD